MVIMSISRYDHPTPPLLNAQLLHTRQLTLAWHVPQNEICTSAATLTAALTATESAAFTDATRISINVLDPPCTKFNCRKDCHSQPRPQWLLDAGSGHVDRRGYRYAFACGEDYTRISWGWREEPTGHWNSCTAGEDGVWGLGPVGQDAASREYAVKLCQQRRGLILNSPFQRAIFIAAGKLPGTVCHASPLRSTTPLSLMAYTLLAWIRCCFRWTW